MNTTVWSPGNCLSLISGNQGFVYVHPFVGLNGSYFATFDYYMLNLGGHDFAVSSPTDDNLVLKLW